MDNRLEVVSQALPGHTAYLEDIHKVRLVGHLDIEGDFMEIEVLKSEVIVELIGGQELFAPDVDRVLGNLQVLPQRTLAGGQLNFGNIGLLGIGRQHHGAI